MKIPWLLPILAGMLWMTGCGDMLSLEPLATKDTAVFDARLLGTWADDEGALCVVRPWDKVNNKAYDIVWIGSGNSDEKTRLKGYLVQFGEQSVLDVSGVDPGAFSVAAHAFINVRRGPGTLELRFIDSEWLQNELRQSAVAHTFVDNHITLTAPTAQVRTFLEQSGMKEEALDKPILLTHLVPEAASKPAK